MEQTCLLHYPTRYHISSLGGSGRGVDTQVLDDMMEHPTGVVSINSEIAQEKLGMGGKVCNFHSLLFLLLSDNLEEITGCAGVDSPWLDVPTLPALPALESTLGVPAGEETSPAMGLGRAQVLLPHLLG